MEAPKDPTDKDALQNEEATTAVLTLLRETRVGEMASLGHWEGEGGWGTDGGGGVPPPP